MKNRMSRWGAVPAAVMLSCFTLASATIVLPAIVSPAMAAGVVTTDGATGHYQPSVSQQLDAQTKRLQPQLAGTGTQLIRTADTLQLSMPNALLFGTNVSTLSNGVKPVLDNVINVLRDFPDTGIHIDGYTDSTGAAAYNKQLSELRAHSVGDYLARGGLDFSRLTMVGHGASHFVATNATAQGRAKNRRVTITLIPPHYPGQVVQGQITPQQYQPTQTSAGSQSTPSQTSPGQSAPGQSTPGQLIPY